MFLQSVNTLLSLVEIPPDRLAGLAEVQAESAAAYSVPNARCVIRALVIPRHALRRVSESADKIRFSPPSEHKVSQ